MAFEKELQRAQRTSVRQSDVIVRDTPWENPRLVTQRNGKIPAHVQFLVYPFWYLESVTKLIFIPGPCGPGMKIPILCSSVFEMKLRVECAYNVVKSVKNYCYRFSIIISSWNNCQITRTLIIQKIKDLNVTHFTVFRH